MTWTSDCTVLHPTSLFVLCSGSRLHLGRCESKAQVSLTFKSPLFISYFYILYIKAGL